MSEKQPGVDLLDRATNILVVRNAFCSQLVSCRIVAVLVRLTVGPLLPNSNCGPKNAKGAVTLTCVQLRGCRVPVIGFVNVPQGTVVTVAGPPGITPALFSQFVAIC